MENQPSIRERTLLKENTLSKDFKEVKVKGEEPQSLCKQIGMVGNGGGREAIKGKSKKIEFFEVYR